MKRILLLALVALAAGALSFPAAAADIGVVFMHGKWGTANPKSPIGPVVDLLRRSGYDVEAPDMPWSKTRAYDRDVEGALAEIDAAVKRLQGKGAKRIVVGGQSMGANMALAYGARRDGLAGIMAIAPGHTPETADFRNGLAADYARALEMAKAGKGDESSKFLDINQGERRTVSAKARVYASWLDPDGMAVMPKNAAQLRPGTPLLWVVGESDGMAKRGEAYAFAKAPPHPKNTYTLIQSGHADAPAKAAGEIIAWLKVL